MSEELLEKRVRDVEKLATVVQTNLGNISQNITEMKQMFQKMAAESLKVAELSTKVQAIDRLEKRNDDLTTQVHSLQRELLIVRSKQDNCLLSRGEEGATMKDLFNKISAIEAAYQKMEASLDSLKQSKGRVENVLWKWVERAGWILIIGLMYLLFTNGNVSKLSEFNGTISLNQTPIVEIYRG